VFTWSCISVAQTKNHTAIFDSLSPVFYIPPSKYVQILTTSFHIHCCTVAQWTVISSDPHPFFHPGPYSLMSAQQTTSTFFLNHISLCSFFAQPFPWSAILLMIDFLLGPWGLSLVIIAIHPLVHSLLTLASCPFMNPPSRPHWPLFLHFLCLQLDHPSPKYPQG
jgi:hypothetical protein